MKKMRRRTVTGVEDENFWPAFTDMISTIALILFFLMLLSYISSIVAGKNLEHTKQELLDTQTKLDEKIASITEAEENLKLLKDDLADTMAEVEAGSIALKLSEEEISKQKEIIAASNTELGNLRTRLKGIALLRLNVVEKVKDSIEGELGATTDAGEELVLIGDNGNIVINESLVFDTNSFTVKEEGEELLTKLADAFEKVLSNPDIRDSIDAINIQGHTDERGSHQYNRELSSKRAYSVVNFMMDSNSNLVDKYGKYFAASAYSEFRPISTGTSEEAYNTNRRIEISIILKDSNIQNVIDNYLEETLSDFQGE